MKKVMTIIISVIIAAVFVLMTGCSCPKVNTDELPVNLFASESEDSVKLPATIKAGEKLDLSEWYEVDGVITRYYWQDRFTDDVYPAYEKDGVFIFSDEYIGEKIQCELINKNFTMKNKKKTSISRYTTCIEIVQGDEPVENEVSIWEKIFLRSPLIPILVLALWIFFILYR